MLNTNGDDVSFKEMPEIFSEIKQQADTLGLDSGMNGIFKITKKNDKEEVSSGYIELDCFDQKKQRAYRKINKMLGGY